MIAGHWNHDSTLTDTYRDGAFYDRWSEVYSIRFIRFEEGLLRYMFIQDDVEYVSGSYFYDIEGSSIKIWPYSGQPEGKLLPTTIEEIYYLSRE